MKKIIHKYLSDYYTVKGNNVYSNKKSLYLSSYFFVKELEAIFGLTKKELKWVIKSWIRKQNKGFNFRDYWTPPAIKFDGKSSTLPMIRRIMARTVESELFEVQPMAMPSAPIFFMEPVVNRLERFENRRLPIGNPLVAPSEGIEENGEASTTYLPHLFETVLNEHRRIRNLYLPNPLQIADNPRYLNIQPVPDLSIDEN